jgi:uncharacterized protein with FMN-binding domain
MRRVVLALALTAAGLVALVMYKTPSGLPGNSAALTDQTGRDGAVQGRAAPNGNGNAQGGNAAGGAARRVTGPVAQTVYGPVQVRLDVTANGRIVKALAVRYPNSGQSQQISQQSLPVLDRAVVSTQGQKVDTVSGATQTSEGYKQSLQAALDQIRG